MQKVYTQRHSALYYRNTIILWTNTILVFWFALTAPRTWISMVVFLLGILLCNFLWMAYWIYPRLVLLISTSQGKECYCVRRFYDAAQQPKSIFEVPKASNGIAAAVDRMEYRERVLRAFDGVLGCVGDVAFFAP